MLFPTLSVTLIGLAVGGIVAVISGRGKRSILPALIGAWIGFLLGGLAGVVIDVVARSGIWVVIAGHGAALVGSIVASARAADNDPALTSAR